MKLDGWVGYGSLGGVRYRAPNDYPAEIQITNQPVLKLISIQMIKCSGQRRTLICCLQRRPSIAQRKTCCHNLFFLKNNRYLNISIARRQICCHNLFFQKNNRYLNISIARRKICCHKLFFQKNNRYLTSQHMCCLDSFFQDTNLLKVSTTNGQHGDGGLFKF